MAALLGISACGGDGIVLPDEGLPADIEVVDGDGQAGPAGAALSSALVVEVTDARGRPVSDQQVTFSVLSGNGQVAPATDNTDADGLASVTWTLGPGAGAQRVRAQVTGTGISTELTVEFTATAVAGTGSTLVLVSGDGQSGAVGSALADPLVVRVVDPLGNPVSGQTVTWSVTGGGSIDPASSVTGDDGETSAQRVLGPSSGAQSAQATAAGLAGSPVTFTHTAGASAPSSLVMVSGDDQTAPAGFQLPDSLVVRLLDVNGNGVGGRTVAWVVGPGAGVAAPINSQTDPQGYAVTRWTLGPTAGSYTLNAVFSGLPSVPFSATATADVPTAMAMVSGNAQTAAVGTTLPSPLRVRVTDANGNGVENVSVTWAAIGGGSVSSTTSGTDNTGIAEVSRTLGAAPGTYATSATVTGLAGSPVNFTATATVGPPARLAFIAQPANTVTGQTLSAVQVEIQDAQGNRVVGATNSVTIASSVAGTLTGDNSENAVAGVATFSGLAITKAGNNYHLNALASGLTSTASDDFDVAKASTTIAITADNPDPSTLGQSVTINYDINITAPGAGSLTGSVVVSDGTQQCIGGINAGTGVGSCSISFTSAGSRTLTATYSGDANFNGSTSGGAGHAVNKASTTTQLGTHNPRPSVVGEPITVNYTVNVVSPAVGPATGSVTVSDGTASCSAAATAGSCVLVPTSAGNKTITVTYDGNDDFNGSSDSEPHQVNAAATATTITLDDPDPSSTNQAVTVNFTVVPVAPGGGTPSGNVTVSASGGPETCNGSVTAGSCVITLTVAGVNRTLTATYAGNANYTGSSGTASHAVEAVNTPPTAGDDAFSIGEGGTINDNVLDNDSDPETGITAELVTGPSHAANFSLNANGTFTYTPALDYFGPDEFTYRASDGSLTDQATVTITVTPVNDIPSFTAGPNQEVSAFFTQLGVTVPGWAQNVSPGPNETGQTVSFQVSTDNDAAFAALPAVSSNGTLTFRPELRGDTVVVTVTVVAQDSEGASSAPQQFTITINP